MNAIVPTTRYTPDDLLRMPDGDRYELIDGQLKERGVGGESSSVGVRIAYFITAHVEQRQPGVVFGADAGYQCFPGRPSLVRYPDVSFVRGGRLPGDRPPRGHCRVAPDLSVEVVSPNDLAEELDEKIAEFFGAGTPVIWVAYPLTRVVVVLRADGSATRLTADQKLTGEPILPGFRCRVGDLFPPAPPAPSPAPPETA
jgi:Uma2 family endonuclease